MQHSEFCADMKKNISGLTQRLIHLAILTFLALLGLFYPLKLKDSWILWLRSIFQGLDRDFNLSSKLYNIYDLQIEPLIYFGVSPLILKAVIAEIFAVFLLITFLAYKLSLKGERIKVSAPQIVLSLLLLLCCFSMQYTPTLDFSLKTLFKIFAFVIIFLVMKGIPKSPAFVIKSIVLLIIVGAILEIVALLQRFGLLKNFMFEFPSETYGRNLMGAFIGHNTGLAAFLFPILLLAIGLLFRVKSRLRMILVTVFCVMTIFLLILLQSRSGWLNMVLLTPVFAIVAARIWGKNIVTLRNLLTAVVIVLLLVGTQIFDTPLKVKNPSLVERFRDLTPEVLKTETRLRIPLCSISLIKEDFFFGHGIGSFQYIYPPAQGKYFADNPDTFIAPTQKRTEHAHNDYLQILIELGVAGLLLSLLLAFLYLREGFREYKVITAPENKIIQLSILFALVSLMIQAGLDFPLHIPPLAALFIFFAALWSDCGNIWNQAEAKDCGAQACAAVDSKENAAPDSKARRIILWGAFGGVAVFAFIYGAFTFREQMTDIYELRGESFLSTYYENPNLSLNDKSMLIKEAQAVLRKAWRLEPLNGKALFFWGQSYYIFADLFRQQMRAADSAGYKKEADNFKEQALILLKNAAAKTHEAMNEFRNHSTLQQLGLIFDMYYSILPYERQYFYMAKDAYAKSVAMNPFFVPSLQSLADLYLAEMQKIESGEFPPPPNYNAALSKEKIYSLRKTIAIYGPQYWEKNFIGKALNAIFDEKTDEAIAIFKDLLKVTPDDYRLHLYLVSLYLDSNRIADAEEKVETAKQLIDLKIAASKNKDEIRALSLEAEKANLSILLRKNNIEESLEICQNLIEAGLPEKDYYQALLVILLDKAGKSEEADELSKKLFASKEARFFLVYMGTIYYYIFNEPVNAQKFLEESLKTEPLPQVKTLLILAKIYYAEKRFDKAQEYVSKISSIAPWHKPTQDLQRMIRAAVVDSASNSDEKADIK